MERTEVEFPRWASREAEKARANRTLAALSNSESSKLTVVSKSKAVPSHSQTSHDQSPVLLASWCFCSTLLAFQLDSTSFRER